MIIRQGQVWHDNVKNRDFLILHTYDGSKIRDEVAWSVKVIDSQGKEQERKIIYESTILSFELKESLPIKPYFKKRLDNIYD